MRRFWQSFGYLAAFVAAMTCLSLIYIEGAHLSLVKPSNQLEFLTLPEHIPSVWDIVRPAVAASWVMPLLVLLVQVLLTGGFFGTLLRMNLRQQVNANTFASDSIRSFIRLLIWTLLWDLLSLLVTSLSRLMYPLGVTAAIALFAMRFAFLFGSIALVSEQGVPFGKALGAAGKTMLARFVPMLPYGLGIALLTGVSMAITASLPTAVIVVLSILYTTLMTWLWHMVVARYLFYSRPLTGDAS
ncbi:hypothetical protein LLE49_16745 [Alicyclobacillus tolerans]|uniref:hypothetical protein n=1 Tax=Alicyclobacillus tolerans TaxID=90970 RepID=UPI001F23434A|nr:hypothetical protein [Alicyclobacillus tolerans]MCF8566372.1 hypothetical protein [Alicyclobacillus tolerans]